MRMIRKFRKRLIIFLAAALILAAGALFAIMHFYGDEVKDALLSQLNERLEVEVAVEEISIDLFANFPKGSLRLKGINSTGRASSAGKSLLKAGEIALLFNLFDIFRGSYTIQRVNLYDAFLNLEVNETGDANYHLFKKGKASDGKTRIDLNKVHFRNVVVSYVHTPSQQEYLFRIDKGNLEGSFSSQVQQFHFGGLLHSSHIRSGKHVFLQDKELRLDTEITIDRDAHSVRFARGDIHSGGLDFHVTGTVSTGDARQDLALSVKVDRSPVSSLLKLIPPEYLEPIGEISLDGMVVLEASITGNFLGNQIPRVEVGFTVDGGSFRHDKSGMKLTGMGFTGNFSTGSASSESSYQLQIRELTSAFEGGTISGSLEVSNFSQPRIHTRIITSARIEELSKIFRIDTLQDIRGQVEMNLEFSNQLKDFRRFTISDFLSSKTTGTMTIRGMQFRLRESPLAFDDFNGTFSFNNKDLKVEQFSGVVSGTDFRMKGYFRNILAYAFMPGESIFINADLHSRNFNLDRLLETGKGSGDTKLSFSDRVNYNLNIEIDTFTFRKFTSTSNVGRLIQNERKLHVKNTRIRSMDGQVTLDGSIDGASDQVYYIDCTAEFQGVNIEKLFRDFGNFGQQNITDAHLRGTVDARVHYSSTLTPVLFVDQRSVYTLADVEIYNGELIQYEPLKKLSRYVKEEDLEHIRFSTLKNRIRIEHEVVHIPLMDIASSSLNLSLYGEHTFDNEIDYHIQLLLAEILSRKDPVEEDLGDNFVSDDGSGRAKLFLSMTGSADDPVVKYDTREVRSKIASDLKKEREELKQAFREEFGGRPTGQVPGDAGMTEGGTGQKDFIFQWDETKPEEKVQEKKTGEKTAPQRKEQKQEFIIQWDERKDTIDRDRPRLKK